MTSKAAAVRRRDLAVAAAWVPFAVVAIVIPDTWVRWFALGVLLLSLAHQPLTLGLVYGDPVQRRARARFFLWAPVVLAAVILVGQAISFMLVAVIGGLWNTEHTLMQRYGLVRIHRRRRGDETPGRLDLLLLASWLVLVLAWAVRDPRTPDRIETLGLGTANERGLEVLVDIRPAATVLFALAVVGATVCTWRWLANEAANRFGAGAGVYGYVGATAALFAVAVVHPIAGLLAWVGAHAVEYFVVVHESLGRREPGAAGSLVDRASTSGARALAFMVAVSAVGSAVVLLAQYHAGLTVYGVIFFGIGGLHILYDGVIWKLRRPEVARSLDIDVAVSEVAR
ncbi:MAG: hypothetical protein AAF480_15855 [Actinomycetota bacterium]